MPIHKDKCQQLLGRITALARCVVVVVVAVAVAVVVVVVLVVVAAVVNVTRVSVVLRNS